LKKRTKKLLTVSAETNSPILNPVFGATDKSFLLLFFKKEVLPLLALLAACTPPAVPVVPALAPPKPVALPLPRVVEVVAFPRPAWPAIATGDLPGGGTITEYAPPGETASDWTEMATTLALPPDEEPAARMTAILDGLRERCRSFRILLEAADSQFVRCDTPRAAGADGVELRHHEAMWFKTLRGREHGYVVWRAWHGDAVTRDTVLGSADTRQEWQSWIDQVSLANRPAPG
jgi:hypothetical protein